MYEVCERTQAKGHLENGSSISTKGGGALDSPRWRADEGER